MALIYGFTQKGGDSKLAEEYYAHSELNEELLEFMHNKLCWLLMGTCIEYVTESTIPHILSRMEMFLKPEFAELQRLALDQGLPHATALLEKFLGFKVNVQTETSVSYIKQMTCSMLKITKKGVEALHTDNFLVKRTLEKERLAAFKTADPLTYVNALSGMLKEHAEKLLSKGT